MNYTMGRKNFSHSSIFLSFKKKSMKISLNEREKIHSRIFLTFELENFSFFGIFISSLLFLCHTRATTNATIFFSVIRVEKEEENIRKLFSCATMGLPCSVIFCYEWKTSFHMCMCHSFTKKMNFHCARLVTHFH